MKFVLLGSLGNVTRPLATSLIKQNHTVSIVTSKAERCEEITKLGGHPLVGDAADVKFLTESFKGADAVYLMTPFPGIMTLNVDIIREATVLAVAFRQALIESEVKHAVLMTSIGAHSPHTPMLGVYHSIESILQVMPPYGANVTFVRPVDFYENLLQSLPEIKATGTVTSTSGADDDAYYVSSLDIAKTIEKQLFEHVNGKAIHGSYDYVCSDILTNAELIKIVGQAISKELKWNQITPEQMTQFMMGMGTQKEIATMFPLMYCMPQVHEHFDSDGKPVYGTVKAKDFAKTFAETFAQIYKA